MSAVSPHRPDSIAAAQAGGWNFRTAGGSVHGWWVCSVMVKPTEYDNHRPLAASELTNWVQPGTVPSPAATPGSSIPCPRPGQPLRIRQRRRALNGTDPTGYCFWDVCAVETLALVGAVALAGWASYELSHTNISSWDWSWSSSSPSSTTSVATSRPTGRCLGSPAGCGHRRGSPHAGHRISLAASRPFAGPPPRRGRTVRPVPAGPRRSGWAA